MEASSSEFSLSFWDYIYLFLLRPAFAIAFVLSFIAFGWFLAWKLVLVHVPLVQEICGLRKKPLKPKPPTRRLSKIYSNINARSSASEWYIYFSPIIFLFFAIMNRIYNFIIMFQSNFNMKISPFLNTGICLTNSSLNYIIVDFCIHVVFVLNYSIVTPDYC